MRNDATQYQTRGVLAGAYRGRNDGERSNLTHLVNVATDGESSLCRRVKPGMMADEFSASSTEDLQARPTCPYCAKKWDKLFGVAK